MEAISSCAEEIASLLIKHYDEVGIDPSIEYHPNWADYLSYELTDSCKIVTARYNEVLVGYAIYLIGPFKHNKHVEYADLDAFWIHPEFRSGFLAMKMLKRGEKELADRVEYIMATSTTKLPIGALYSRMGFTPIETVYWKKLGDTNGKQESSSSTQEPSVGGTDRAGLELSEHADVSSSGEPVPPAGI